MRVKSLSFNYSKGDFSLDDISLDIPDRKVTCVLGPNGSGKTTLLKILGGLLEAKGAIFINGSLEPVSSRGVLRNLSAYSGFPIFVDVLMDMKIIEILLTSRYNVSKTFFDSAHDHNMAKAVSEELGISHLLDRKPNEISGGELQKVLIGLAMMKRPRYYLLDEPDAHIDTGFKPELSKIIKKLSQEATVIIATHDSLFAQFTCDYFIIMKDGEILFKGSKKDLLSSLDVLEKSFGVKFVRVYIEEIGLTAIPVYNSKAVNERNS